MKFPPYPTDILSRADALLSSKYPDGIVDPRFVEVACEAMMAERSLMARELLAKQAQELNMGYDPTCPHCGVIHNHANACGAEGLLRQTSEAK